MKAMVTVVSNLLERSILKDALVTMRHPFLVQVSLKLVMLALMMLKEVALEMVMNMLDLEGLPLMLVMFALTLKIAGEEVELKAMTTVMSNLLAGSILKDAVVTTMHPFPVQVDLKSVMLTLMMLKEVALEMVMTVLDLAGLTLMLVMLASMLKEVLLEMTVLDLAGLTLMHLRVKVAEMLVIFWIEVFVVSCYSQS